jgi:hypothetical protein
MREKVWELDNEIHFKDTFRVFSKDEEGKSVELKCQDPDPIGSG